MRRTVTLLVAIAVGGMLLGACSSDEEAKPVAIEVSQAGDAPSLKAPTTSDTGFIELSFKNSAQLPADVQFISVEGNHSAQEVLQVINSEGGPIPEWLSGAGGVGTVGPGQTGTATVKLEKGKYIIVGSLESEEENGPPEATASFEVTDSGGGSLPSTDGTITAKDYTFEADGLKPGRNTITFKNDGPKENHHVIAAPINQGATLDQVKTFFTTEGEPAGPPPVDFEAGVGTAVIDEGQELVTTVELKPGKYAFVCFITDRAGGPPHVVSHNMIKEITVAS